MITTYLSYKTVVTFVGMGVATFVGEKVLDHIGKPEFKKALEFGMFAGALVYIAVTGFGAINTVIKIWM